MATPIVVLFVLTKNCLTSFSRPVLSRPIPGEEVWSRTDTESLGASGAEDEDPITDFGGMVGLKKKNGWRTIRHLVRFTPFMNTFRKRLYPWVQVTLITKVRLITKDNLYNDIVSWLAIKTASCAGSEEMGLS